MNLPPPPKTPKKRVKKKLVEQDDGRLLQDTENGTAVDADKLRATIFYLWNKGYKFEAMRLIWRDRMIDCEPMRRLVTALSTHRRLLVLGHGSAGKTHTAVGYGLMDWWNDAVNSALVLTSSTLTSLRFRAWADAKLLHRDTVVNMPGRFQATQYIMHLDRGDEKHVIMGVAGEKEDSAVKIQGLHTKRLFLIIDEADNPYNVAIWKAVANLGTSGDFRVVALANPNDRNSMFGMNAEPEGGWESVKDKDEWDSRTGYHVLRLNGLDSPNIVAHREALARNEPPPEPRFPFLLTQQGIDDIVREFGEHSPNYQTYVLAQFPENNSFQTVFDGQTVSQLENQKIIFHGQTTPVAGCDPSQGGGDRCVVMVGRAGVLASDPRKGCVVWAKYYYITRGTGGSNSPATVSKDFGEQIMALMEKDGVIPSMFAIGNSVADQGLADYLTEAWGPVWRMEHAGKPSNRKILQEDTKLPVDRFDRLLTEIWWAMREWAKAGQMAVRFHCRDLRIQLESRRCEDNRGLKVLRLETKDELRKRGHKSPNEADAISIGCALVREKFGTIETTHLKHDPNLRAQVLTPSTARDVEEFEPSYKADPVLNVDAGSLRIEHMDSDFDFQDLDY